MGGGGSSLPGAVVQGADNLFARYVLTLCLLCCCPCLQAAAAANKEAATAAALEAADAAVEQGKPYVVLQLQVCTVVQLSQHSSMHTLLH